MKISRTSGDPDRRRVHRLLALFFLAGVALRLFFVLRFPTITPDGRLYLSLAETWARSGVYGTDPATPSDLRVPGYPAFLAGIHLLFGSTPPLAVFLLQTVVDLATCVVVAMLARAIFGDRAGRIAFALALLCPFTANYVSLMLTETLAIFTTAVALLLGVLALQQLPARFPSGHLLGLGAAIGAGMLIRPDAAVLLPVFGVALLWRARGAGWKRAIAATAFVGAVSLAFLLPWTLRNALRFGRFQPLNPGVVVGRGERVPIGFNRWLSTWILDYVSDQEVWWKMFSHERIDPAALPPRAFGSRGDPARTLSLIAEFNDKRRIDEPLDRKFDDLAAERIRARPWSHYAIIPFGRMADMWLRPRTEMLPVESRWWEFRNARRSWFSIGYAALNLVYVALAFRGALRNFRRFEVWVLVGFAVVRTAAIATVGNPCSPEERYTLECFPAVFALAAAGLSSRDS